MTASVLVLACAPAGALASISLTSPGATAIARVGQKVARLTGASSYKLTGCLGRGYKVKCSIRWSYRSQGFSCTERFATQRVGRATKVRTVSPVRCR